MSWRWQAWLEPMNLVWAEMRHEPTARSPAGTAQLSSVQLSVSEQSTSRAPLSPPLWHCGGRWGPPLWPKSHPAGGAFTTWADARAWLFGIGGGCELGLCSGLCFLLPLWIYVNNSVNIFGFTETGSDCIYGKGVGDHVSLWTKAKMVLRWR